MSQPGGSLGLSCRPRNRLLHNYRDTTPERGTNQPTGIAILNQCAAGSSCKTYFASTGSITVSDVSSSSVTGTFDLTLINNDHEPQGALSGILDATTCP